ncbi:MAG TPA: hypothetical protein VHQ86_05610 [Candidatus Saccharimonadia bacterium]|jgi:hypothetical protein|nr:hypothetical protein [Candidatus Saccharimonadia bacterium]
MPKLKTVREQLAKIAALLITLSSLFLNVQTASANTLAQAKVALSDPRPSVPSNYTFTGGQTGGLVSSTLIKCVMVTISTATGGTVAPTGFTGNTMTVNAAASTLINSSATGWSLVLSDGAGSAGGAKNVAKYTNSTGVTPSTTSGATFELDAGGSSTNSSVADTKYWFTLQTFGNTDCATSPVDNAAPLFINTNGSTLSLTVDQTLTFTVNAVGASQSCDGTTTTQASTATTIPFGTVTSASDGVVCQDLTASTNATNGYTIYARYTAAPTNALAQTIADWTGTNAAPTAFPAAGTEAYGYTTNDATLGTGTANRFTSPSQGWAKMTTSNNEVAYEAAGVTSTTYRIGHQVGVSLTTHPGTYTTTVIYTCTPVF